MGAAIYDVSCDQTCISVLATGAYFALAANTKWRTEPSAYIADLLLQLLCIKDQEVLVPSSHEKI